MEKTHISGTWKGSCYYQTPDQFFLTDPRTSVRTHICENSGLPCLIRSMGRACMRFQNLIGRFPDIIC